MIIIFPLNLDCIRIFVEAKLLTVHRIMNLKFFLVVDFFIVYIDSLIVLRIIYACLLYACDCLLNYPIAYLNCMISIEKSIMLGFHIDDIECMPRDRVYGVKSFGPGLNLIVGFTKCYCSHKVISIVKPLI